MIADPSDSVRVMPAPEPSTLLPWERASGAPEGVGIALSGGGLRAAAFSLGVVQALQETRGLLYGPNAARNLSAVSGGSYTAGAVVLGGQHRAAHPEKYADGAPLRAGSPEAEHIMANGNFLKAGAARIALLVVLNVLALLMLFIWTGVMLGNAAALLRIDALDAMPWPITAVVAVALYWIGIRWYYRDDSNATIFLGGLLIVAAAVAFGPTIRHLDSIDGWQPWVIGVPLGLVVLTAIASTVAARAGISGVTAAGANRAALLAPRLVGIGLIAVSSNLGYDFIRDAFSRDDDVAILLALGQFFAVLVGALVFSHVPHRASLHREYREMLRSCFGVVRDRDTDGTTRAALGTVSLLSEFAPPSDPSLRYPRLLVAATANVRAPRPRSPSFAPFVLSFDACGVPNEPDAVFETRKLEYILEPASVFRSGTEPLVSLFTAIAANGAALSPSMGRFTSPSLRMILAALNVRLGRWLPNVMRPSTRAQVKALSGPGNLQAPARFGPGYNELIPELAGLDGPRMYLSDGGHYDNLGLLALLRTRCAEIWCIDSSDDPEGAAEELRRVLRIAELEMGIGTDLDPAAFTADSDGLYPQTHASADLTYPGGEKARLVVLKVGLTASSPPDLKDRRSTDPGFPHHKTFPHQFYDSSRMNAYRELGVAAVTEVPPAGPA